MGWGAEEEYSSNDGVLDLEGTRRLLRKPVDGGRDRSEGRGTASMKVMTILGTRPEIIRLSGVIPLLDRASDHVLVHTGQNYDDRLSRIFFAELNVRDPDVYMGVRSSGFAGQIGQILEKSEELFMKYRPDRLLILGDTNSGISAIVARRLGIPVYHMEAGNRCFDDRVPEEVNRRVIDHCSSVLMPYTHRSKENLLREGIPGERIFVTGNPIKGVIDQHEKGRSLQARCWGCLRSMRASFSWLRSTARRTWMSRNGCAAWWRRCRCCTGITDIR
jgi:UDP-N-acetylglucosamine 2-epimerase